MHNTILTDSKKDSLKMMAKTQNFKSIEESNNKEQSYDGNEDDVYLTVWHDYKEHIVMTTIGKGKDTQGMGHSCDKVTVWEELWKLGVQWGWG